MLLCLVRDLSSHEAGVASADAGRGGGVLLWVPLLVGLHVALACLFLCSGAADTLPLDDAYTYLVYARSLARDLTLAYNPGQWATGTTGVLHAVLLAPLLGLGVGPVFTAKALSLAGGLVAAFGVERLTTAVVRDVAPQSRGARAAGVVAALLLTLNPYGAFARVSGMDVTTAWACVVWCLVALHRDRLGLAGLLAGLSACARPEAGILVLLVPAVHVLRLEGMRPTRASLWPAGRFALAAALPLVPWIAWSIAVSGRPLPASFYVKTALLAWNDPRHLGKVLTFFTEGPLPFAATVSVGFALGCVALARRRSTAGMVALLYPIAGLLWLTRSRHVGADTPMDTAGSFRCFYFARYFLLYLPLLICVFTVGLFQTGHHLYAGIARRRGAWRWGPLLGTVVVLVAAGVHWLGRYPLFVRVYAANCQNIRSLQVAVAYWLRDNTRADEVVATNDAGAIRFYSERQVIDLVGLNYRPLAFRGGGDTPAAFAHLHQVRPRWFAIFPVWYPSLLTRSGIRFELAHEVAVARASISGSRRMVVLSASYPPSAGTLPTGP
jgi:hypothetical protein